MKRLVLALALLATVFVPAPGRSAAPGPCPGPAESSPPTVVTGTFGKELQGAYVLVPFTVPPDRTRVRVKLCYDQPNPTIAVPGVVTLRPVLDLGIYEPRPAGDATFDENEFRGWGGSSRLNVLITPEGAVGDEPANASSTTLGFLPGEIPPGEWAAELGVAAVTGPTEGNPGSSVAWRLEIYTASISSDVDDPWTPAAYDGTPANANPGWYSGDMHVHAEHSFPAGATMRETFDYAFKEAGLDFITLSDYGTSRHWGEIGRFQPDYPGHLIIRSAELITYRGHVNNHATARFVDYRTGAIYFRNGDGTHSKVRDAQPASRMFSEIRSVVENGRQLGWTQVNHPTIFPSEVPAFANICRGCSWSYSDDETNWDLVDAFEVQTGPSGTPSPEGNELGPNPFTPLAIEWFDRLHRTGYDITAVGSSDSHRAGQPESFTQSPVGEATTVVYAPELSEGGIRDGVLAGHAYVKFFGPDGPDLRLTAEPEGGGASVMMGDELVTGGATFTASVLNAKPSVHPRVLLVMLNGLPILAYPVTGQSAEFTFPSLIPGDYRLQLMRGTAFEALTNPITLRAS